MQSSITKWLPIIFGCHCNKNRSFHYKDQQFPLCARCTGELVGIILPFITYFYFRLSIPMSILFLIPMILDGSIQILSNYESTNLKRFITGSLFGYGISTIFITTTIIAFQYGQNLANK